MINKWIILFGAISLVAIFTFVVTQQNFVLSVMTPNTNLADENFDGIYLNQHVEELASDEMTADRLNPNFYYLSNGIDIITNEKRIIQNIAITTATNKTITTHRGISIGDSVQTVKASYGDNYYNRREQGVDIMVYTDAQTFLEFWHWANEVQEIHFGVY